MRASIPGHSLLVGLRAPCLLSISNGEGVTESTPGLGLFHIHLEVYLEVYLSTEFMDICTPDWAGDGKADDDQDASN